jgi:hypothetical protein
MPMTAHSNSCPEGMCMTLLLSDRDVRTEAVPNEDQEQQGDENDAACRVLSLETTLSCVVPRKIKADGTHPLNSM